MLSLACSGPKRLSYFGVVFLTSDHSQNELAIDPKDFLGELKA